MPRRRLKGWVCLMHEVGLLRLPVVFGRAHADFTLSEDGPVATKSVAAGLGRAAASTAVMRSGRHAAQFTGLDGRSMMFGVIPPGWNVEGGENAFNADGHSFATRAPGTATPATTTGRGSRAWRSRVWRSRATASACCSTSTRAA